ncbi:hypothetical protein [Terricaulis sp.]|uniref:hypothetical protein n=1 Tax=Terricaulis sp. TaxID=2768686 RepID=UPI0037837727
MFSPWDFLFQHPLVGLVAFAAVTAGVLVVLSGGRLGESIGSIFRVALTIFTTPFVFLREALNIIRTAGESEQDYEGSRVFMLFRLNRIWYLLLLLICLLVLSSGVTSAALSLYPSAEIARGKALSEQVAELETQLEQANAQVTAAGAPDFRQGLQTRMETAQRAYQTQSQNNYEFSQNSVYINNGVAQQLAGTRNTDYIQRVRENLDGYMQSCPRGYDWRGMTVQDCVQFRAFMVELMERKQREIVLQQQSNEAERAFREADSAAQQAIANQQAIQAQLEATRQAQSEVSLFNPDVIGDRLKTAIMTILGALFMVIVIVWAGAIAIDVGNWFILMMRSLEKTQQEKLEKARTEYTG